MPPKKSCIGRHTQSYARKRKRICLETLPPAQNLPPATENAEQYLQFPSQGTSNRISEDNAEELMDNIITTANLTPTIENAEPNLRRQAQGTSNRVSEDNGEEEIMVNEIITDNVLSPDEQIINQVLEVYPVQRRSVRIAQRALLQTAIENESIEENFININWHRCAFSYNPRINYSMNNKVSIGTMSITCNFCNAKKFPGETSSLCCSRGKVSLQLLEYPPDELKNLIFGNDRQSG